MSRQRVAWAVALGLCASALGADGGSPQAAISASEQLRRDALALTPFVKSPLAKEFLKLTPELPSIAPRVIYEDAAKTKAFSEAAAHRLPAAEREKLVRRELDEEYYYNTRFGSPLSYARLLDLLGEAGVGSLKGKRVIDFGHGYIGHLRLFALMGAEATGVDVDPVIAALYSAPGDTGAISFRSGAPAGKVRLLEGRFPFDASVRRQVGKGYDLFISKNTLKNGYVHPDPSVDLKRTLQMGVDDETFVRAVYALLKPGGKAILYNLFPKQAPPGKPVIAWADGKTPFPIKLWEKAGFQVLHFDVDDSAPARQMGHLLAWDQGEDATDLANNLFGLYTVVEKP